MLYTYHPSPHQEHMLPESRDLASHVHCYPQCIAQCLHKIYELKYKGMAKSKLIAIVTVGTSGNQDAYWCKSPRYTSISWISIFSADPFPPLQVLPCGRKEKWKMEVLQSSSEGSHVHYDIKNWGDLGLVILHLHNLPALLVKFI